MRKRSEPTYRQASRCEWGIADKGCAWCDGKYFGANRVPRGAMFTHFAELPLDDPHFVSVSRKHRGQQVMPGFSASIMSVVGCELIQVPLIGGEKISVTIGQLKRREL